MTQMVEIVDASELVRSVGFAHTAATTGHEPIVINSRVWIPLNDKAADERNAFVHRSLVSNAPKATGAAWAVGDALYWDATAKQFTKTTTSNTLCGFAVEARASGDTTSGLIEFDSFAAIS
jgi:predicted RecA/RadA family phage recombinase